MNYPDDIRRYDDDPRSPFYDGERHCPECGGNENDVECEPGHCVEDDECETCGGCGEVPDVRIRGDVEYTVCIKCGDCR